MIGYISGKVIWQHGTNLIVETGGVGYRIIVTPQALERIENNQIAVYTYLKVSESELTLFGLPTTSHLSCLEQLITVSGVGPKLAMTILSFSEPQNIYQAIGGGDAGFFTRMSGVGKKIAERILVELKDKVINSGELTENVRQSEVATALESLGYNQKDILSALQELDSKTTVAEQIKAALKKLSS